MKGSSKKEDLKLINLSYLKIPQIVLSKLDDCFFPGNFPLMESFLKAFKSFYSLNFNFISKF
jgi:hypothetical protein